MQVSHAAYPLFKVPVSFSGTALAKLAALNNATIPLPKDQLWSRLGVLIGREKTAEVKAAVADLLTKNGFENTATLAEVMMLPAEVSSVRRVLPEDQETAILGLYAGFFTDKVTARGRASSYLNTRGYSLRPIVADGRASRTPKAVVPKPPKVPKPRGGARHKSNVVTAAPLPPIRLKTFQDATPEQVLGIIREKVTKRRLVGRGVDGVQQITAALERNRLVYPREWIQELLHQEVPPAKKRVFVRPAAKRQTP